MAHSTFKVGDFTAVIGDNDICEQRAKEAIAVLAKTAAKELNNAAVRFAFHT